MMAKSNDGKLRSHHPSRDDDDLTPQVSRAAKTLRRSFG